MSKEEARELFYGMPYSEWTERYRTEASPEALAKFDPSELGR